MHEPDYTDYSIDDLRDCLAHVNPAKYPERYRQLETQLRLRTEAGETATDPLIDALTARDVPPSLAIRCFWCFLWRFGLAWLLCELLVMVLATVNTLLGLVPGDMERPLLAATRIVFLLPAGAVIMGQVLAKRYAGYRIRIVSTAAVIPQRRQPKPQPTVAHPHGPETRRKPT